MNDLNNNPEEAQDPTLSMDSLEGGVQEENITESTEQVVVADETESAKEAIKNSLIDLGFVNFDGNGGDNNTSDALVAEDKRKHFRRDVYVGIDDEEQGREFLGRVVEGPFYSPHEVGMDSAITRTTVLHPERTKFRPTYYVNGTIEVLGELVEGERLEVTATRPRPYSKITVFPNDRLANLLDIKGDLFVGNLMGYDDVPVYAQSESKNFIPRNIGIFGTVGSGKSNTTQVMIEEATKAGWAVVVIDVEGEYVQMGDKSDDSVLVKKLRDKYKTDPEGIKDFQVFVPTSGSSEAKAAEEFKVAFSGLDPSVISDILELSEPQVRVLGKAVEQAKQNAQRKSTSSNLGQLASPATPQERSTREFTLQDIIDGLVESDGKAPLVGRVEQQLKSTVYTLRDKLIKLGMSGMLDWNKTKSIPELPVNDLLVGGRLSVLDVSETDDRSRNIAIAYTLQSLFDKVIKTPLGQEMNNGKPRPKVLVVIEEVHTFVSKSNVQKMKAVLDNLQVISRRGRKRWMGLALVSQQPGHVPDELFELANTRFIHQLKSVSNLEPVKRTTGGVHEALWSNIPSLGPGQCLITGSVFKNPLFVNMRPAKSRRLLTS